MTRRGQEAGKADAKPDNLSDDGNNKTRRKTETVAEG